jgi:SHS2 domain-containing protein
MSTAEAPPPYEILEHTADIGLRALGRSLDELFENAAWGLAEILDVDRSDRVIGAAARPQGIVLESSDTAGLLVDWMNELIVLTEEGKACIADVDVEMVTSERLRAAVLLVDCEGAPEGTDLKAATYHQLSVRQRSDRWEAIVYFDV